MTRKVFVVTVEPLWPATHGGRVRTGKIVETLVENGFGVRVVFPNRPGVYSGTVPHGVEQVGLTWTPSSALKRLTVLPWLGIFAMPNFDELQAQIDDYQPDFIYWSHSYLAAIGSRKIDTAALQIVEFANVERDRFLSVSKRGALKNRLSAFVEFVKACFWEQMVARQADLCVAISATDQEILKKLGGNAVLVENALPAKLWKPSPSNAVVVSIANWNYGPNQDGITHFLEKEWPMVLNALPHAKLVLAGNGSTELMDRYLPLINVEAVGFADDLTELFQNAALFLAPARSGAGRQLKVAEALGHARSVVGPTFLNREGRPGLPKDAVRGSDDVVGEIVTKIRNVKERHEVEKKIGEYAAEHDWQFETVTLRRWMAGEGV